MGRDVAAVFERVGHGLLLALFLKAGHAVGVDAALGDDVGSTAGWGQDGELGDDGGLGQEAGSLPTQRAPQPSLVVSWWLVL